MNKRKEDVLNMYLDKIIWYSTYVDCLSRVINEFIENGDDNLKSGDLANLSVLQTKLAYRLRLLSLRVDSMLEFEY